MTANPPTCADDTRIKGIFLSNEPEVLRCIWKEEQRTRLREYVDISDKVFGGADLLAMADQLRDTEVVFSTWGMPLLTPPQLDSLPRLRAVFYAAGAVKRFAPPLWERKIMVVSAAAANAVPVAEYTVSQVLFALKSGWQHVRAFQNKGGPSAWRYQTISGAYGSTVGIISLGQVGRKVCELLDSFTLKKMAYDPYASEKTLLECRAESASLEEVFAQSQVVTIHTPWLKATEGLITGALIASMKPNATLVNTSRGALIRENELIDVLQRRPDLTAVLDVTHPEPPAVDSPLYHLSNVVLTPHLAGSLGNEFQRLSDWMIEEFIAWHSGTSLRHAVNRETLELTA